MDKDEFMHLAKNNPQAAMLELFDMVCGLGDLVAAIDTSDGGAVEVGQAEVNEKQLALVPL